MLAILTHPFREATTVPFAAIFYNNYKGAIDTSDHLAKNVCANHRHRHAFVAKGIIDEFTSLS